MTIPELPVPPRGVSVMTFNFDGSFLATVDQLRPNMVWIWSIETTPRLASALVHEYAVRHVIWHPQKTECLITTANGAFAAVRRWSSNESPAIVRVPVPRSEAGKYDVRWSASEQNGNAVFWFGTGEDYVLGYLEAQAGGLRFNALYSVSSKAQPGSSVSGIGRYI